MSYNISGYDISNSTTAGTHYGGHSFPDGGGGGASMLGDAGRFYADSGGVSPRGPGSGGHGAFILGDVTCYGQDGTEPAVYFYY